MMFLGRSDSELVYRAPQVDEKELQRQAAERRRQAEEEAQALQRHGRQEAAWAAEVARRVDQAEAARRSNSTAAAARLQQQAADKAVRDAAVQELYSNRVSEAYFAQFGTSHR